jgi:uncharacterized protein YndB with AHSA1/START domain
LTTPGALQPFYFNSRFDAELHPGGALTYSSADGKHTFIEGAVVQLTPEAALVHSFRFSDLSEPEQRVTFELSESGGGTRVTVRHEGLERAPRHASRVARGWPHILANLKRWMEEGKLPMRTRVQYALMAALFSVLPKRGR